MRILVDMQGLQSPFSASRGVGTYIRGLLRELPELGREHDFEFLFNAEFPDAYFECLRNFRGLISRRNSHLFSQQIMREYRTATPNEMEVAERFYVEFVDSIGPDLLFSPNLQEGLDDRAVTTFAGQSGRFPQISTLHDLVPLHYRSEYLGDPATARWYQRKLNDAVHCDRIITVSESSALDIIDFLNVSPERVKAIPNGFDQNRFKPLIDQPEEHRIAHALLKTRSEYILYFGGADLHKNLERLIGAYAKLPSRLRDRYKLVIGGGAAKTAIQVQRALRESGISDRVILPGYLQEDLLPALIRQAALFVFPSTHEGFGLPVIEAMACGTPTLGANNSAVGEVIDNPAACFDAKDVDSISNRMRQVLEDEGLRTGIRERGMRRASDFSWRSAAETLLGVMEEEGASSRSKTAAATVARRLSSLKVTEPELLRAAAVSIAESLPDPRPQRIYIDASSVAVHGGNSGIQRVVRAVCNHLQDACEWGDAQICVVYAQEGTTDFRLLTSFDADKSFRVDSTRDYPIDFSPADVLLFVDLQPSLAIRAELYLQRLRALGVQVLYVVYDLLPVLMPENFWPALQREFYRWLQSVSRSDGLLCISETVAQEAAFYLGRYGVSRPDPLRIGHFKLGSDIGSASLSTGISDEQKSLAAEFGDKLKFLMVGTLEPRKGHEVTLQAFEQGWAKGYPWCLIIVGKRGWKMNRLALTIQQHPEFGRRLFWIENASDEWLTSIYKLSDCVICASQGEGFGLPLIEAALEQKPIIARDIPVFREVAGAGAFYFPKDASPAMMLRSIEDWISKHDAGQSIDSGAIKPMSWHEATATLASVIKNERWDVEVMPAGAIDLHQTVGFPNPSLSSSGFYSPEMDFRWTSPRASIGFLTAENLASVGLNLTCFGLRKKNFQVIVDGRHVYGASLDPEPREHIIDVGELPAGPHQLEIAVDEPCLPDGDSRALGLGFKSLTMFENSPIRIGNWVNALDSRIRWNGFSEVEFDWRWSIEKSASFEFLLAEEIPSARISIFGHAAYEMPVTFAVNGRKIFRSMVGVATALISFEAKSLKTGWNAIEVIPENVRMFSNKDRRRLGLAILDFKLDRHESMNNEV